MGWLSAIDLYRFVSCKEVTKSPIFGAFLQAKLQTVAITAHHKYHVCVPRLSEHDTHRLGLTGKFNRYSSSAPGGEILALQRLGLLPCHRLNAFRKLASSL